MLYTYLMLRKQWDHDNIILWQLSNPNINDQFKNIDCLFSKKTSISDLTECCTEPFNSNILFRYDSVMIHKKRCYLNPGPRDKD